MTLKEAVLKSLDEINDVTNYLIICNHIIENKYYDFKNSKTPPATISAVLGDFIRAGDSRVKRIYQTGGSYLYYLAKNEGNINPEILNSNEIDAEIPIKVNSKSKSYDERDLHKILASYLKNTDGVFSKTIFHEQSNGKDSNQIWSHPDMVGIKFMNLKNHVSQNFLKSIHKLDTFKLSSYEIKKEINSDTELKKAYFQAVSNSSWANYGYLVMFEYSNSLIDEMARLNQSFGIGILELNANPYLSKVIFPAKHRELDFKTIDKLCIINKEFERFIEMTEKLMNAETRYYKSTEKEFEEFCDVYFKNDSEAEEYAVLKYIPLEKSKEN